MVMANTVDQSIVERAAAKRKMEKMVIHKEKFNAGAESISTSLKTISPSELLWLLDSKDHVGEVSADNGMSEEQLNQLLDRSDLAWGDHKPVNDTVKAVERSIQSYWPGWEESWPWVSERVRTTKYWRKSY